MSDFGYRENNEPSRIFRIFHTRKAAFLLIATAVVVVLVTFGNKGLLRRFLLGGEVAEKEQRIELLNKDIKALSKQRDKFSTDYGTIERVARESHGMIRPGEIVYRIKAAEPKTGK